MGHNDWSAFFAVAWRDKRYIVITLNNFQIAEYLLSKDRSGLVGMVAQITSYLCAGSPWFCRACTSYYLSDDKLSVTGQVPLLLR